MVWNQCSDKSRATVRQRVSSPPILSVERGPWFCVGRRGRSVVVVHLGLRQGLFGGSPKTLSQGDGMDVSTVGV
eukprot:320593-Lingulodinium_polyedra.AAC.1